MAAGNRRNPSCLDRSIAAPQDFAPRLYVAARTGEFPASEADEVILLNERGDLCEGTITTLFLDDGSGILKTPPLAAGL